MFKTRFVALVVSSWLGSLGLVYGNWTASGAFRYVDREFDQNGFTGAEPALPVRYANVEVRDAKAKGGAALLATGLGVALLIGQNPTSPAKGNATLTEAQAADLIAGRWYVNVHTAANRGGEIRGQVTK